MNILLVYPEMPQTFWSMKHALKFISKKAMLAPLGALTVAAMLPEEWNKKLIDMTVRPLKDKDILWADYVFISAMHIQLKSVKQVVERCKKFQKKIAAGGPLFTIEPGIFDQIDHLLLNEAEVTLSAFLEDLKNGCPKHIYSSEQYADLNTTPVPLWELVNINKYATMSIQYSRGCPFSCDFCNVTSLFGNRMRLKQKEQILAELEKIYSLGWQGPVFFVDDNFIGNKTQLKEHLLPAVIEWMKTKNYPFYFNTQVSINLADDQELIELMVKAGFTTVFIGIETPNEKSLAECKKHQNENRDMLACVKKIQSFGLEVEGGFILGFDSDDVSTFDALAKFIQDSGIVVAMVGLLNAPKGTKLYERLAKEKRLFNSATGDNTDFTMNFMPKMNPRCLVEGYKAVLAKIYSPKNYYQRIKTLLDNYKPPMTIKRGRSGLCEIKAFLKSIWYLGIWRKGRIYYWKIILWSLFKRRRSFPLAVNLAIFGVHFRKMFAA